MLKSKVVVLEASDVMAMMEEDLANADIQNSSRIDNCEDGAKSASFAGKRSFHAHTRSTKLIRKHAIKTDFCE